ADELWEAMLVNSDEIYRDLALRRRLATPDGRSNDLAALRSVSPESPEAISLRLREDEDEIGRHGAAWEAKYANDVIVLRALASAHMGSGRNADAERCLKRVVELAPNWSSFRTLASFYDTTGNEANRMRTMEAALQTNLEGADRGRFSVELAQNALQQGQWEQAASHALTALSYSENDALPVAIEAYQRLGKWADA